MGSELVVRRWCDRCRATEGSSFHPELRVTIGAMDRVVDLCGDCFTGLLAEAASALDGLGQPAPKASRRPGRPPGSPAKPKADPVAVPTLLEPEPEPGGGKWSSAEGQLRLLDQHPDAVACPICLRLHQANPGTGGPRRNMAQHMRVHHGASIRDYTEAQLAEADARARDRLKLLVA